MSKLNFYMEQTRKKPVLSREEQLSLIRDYNATNNSKSRDKLVETNLRLVVKLAHSVHKKFPSLELTDLVQCGTMGLIEAIEKKIFDPDRGFAFMSWASYWIMVYMYSYVTKNMYAMRLGGSVIDKKLFFHRGILKEIIEIENEEQRQLKLTALSIKTKVPEEEILEYIHKAPLKFFSIDTPVAINNGASLEPHDYLYGGDSREEIEHHIQQLDQQRLISEVIDSLNEREQFIIKNRYLREVEEINKETGEILKPDMTLRELGCHYGISRERIRQIESVALAKLKTRLEKIDEIIK